MPADWYLRYSELSLLLFVLALVLVLDNAFFPLQQQNRITGWPELELPMELIRGSFLGAESSGSAESEYWDRSMCYVHVRPFPLSSVLVLPVVPCPTALLVLTMHDGDRRPASVSSPNNFPCNTIHFN